jgi:hypothetical protein
MNEDLFEENEAKAELLERVMHARGFANFRSGRRMN